MKVRELIAELQKHDPEAVVVTDAYEMGVQDLRLVVSATAYRNTRRPRWCGRFELNSPGEYTAQGEPPVAAVYLPRLDDSEAVDG